MSQKKLNFVALKQEEHPDELIDIELWAGEDADFIKTLLSKERPRLVNTDVVFIGNPDSISDELLNILIQSDERSFWDNYMKQYADSLKKGYATLDGDLKIKYKNYKTKEFSCDSSKDSLLTALEVLGHQKTIAIILNRSQVSR